MEVKLVDLIWFSVVIYFYLTSKYLLNFHFGVGGEFYDSQTPSNSSHAHIAHPPLSATFPTFSSSLRLIHCISGLKTSRRTAKKNNHLLSDCALAVIELGQRDGWTDGQIEGRTVLIDDDDVTVSPTSRPNSDSSSFHFHSALLLSN